jgi:hypothetical protein
MNVLLLVIIIIIIIIYNSTCKNVEYFTNIKEEDIRFKESDKLFIPYSSGHSRSLATDYYMMPRKIYSKSDGLIDSILRLDPKYNDYIYDFPYDEPNISQKYKRDSNVTYLSQFQDIILDNERPKYKSNKILDKYMVIDPLNSEYEIDMENDVIPTNYDIPRYFKDTCEYVECPYGKKIINSKRNNKIFNIESKDSEEMCCGPL